MMLDEESVVNDVVDGADFDADEANAAVVVVVVLLHVDAE